MTTTNTAPKNAAVYNATVAAGGRVWQGGTQARVYIPETVGAARIGLRVARYGSGNVSSATLNGDKISNGGARDMLRSLEQTYYDVIADKFHGNMDVAASFRAEVQS